MEVLYPRCSGLDVHKDLVVACVRLAIGEQVHREVRRFGTTTKELLKLLDWLRECRVTHVAMESTGVYWKPVWHVLEGQLELVLGNAKEMRNVPGRKTDQNDASWIADLQAHGLIRNSYIPPEPVQELRDLTRTRKQLVRERAQHVQRIQKVLEDANVKLSSVLADVMGLSGRRILHAIVRGEDDPMVLARLAHPTVKTGQEKLAEALQGRVRDHHRYMIQLHLEQIESLESALSSVEARLDSALAPFREQIERLCTIPGVSETVASVIVAECGDLSAFPTAGHLVAWAGLSPQQHETAGKRKNVRTKRQRWLKTTLVQAAHAAVKKRDSYLRSKYYRIRARRGAKKAIVAIAATMLRSAYHMLERGEDYADLGPDHHDSFSRSRAAQRLVSRLQKLGYAVDLKAAA